MVSKHIAFRIEQKAHVHLRSVLMIDRIEFLYHPVVLIGSYLLKVLVEAYHKFVYSATVQQVELVFRQAAAANGNADAARDSKHAHILQHSFFHVYPAFPQALTISSYSFRAVAVSKHVSIVSVLPLSG